MPKQKLKFQGSLETYLEQEKVHDIFEDMMKALIKDRPKNPIEFLIDKLTAPESKLTFFELFILTFLILNTIDKRIVLVLPPGLKQNKEDAMNVALMLNNHLKEDLGIDNISYISVSDLLMREINKRSEYGKRIYESRKTYSYI